MVTKLFGKGQFLLGGGKRRRFIRRAMGLADMAGKRGKRGGAIIGAGFRHLNQSGPAEAAKPKEATAKRLPALAGHMRRVLIPEGKAAGHGPFAGFRRLVENHGIGRIKPEGAGQPGHAKASARERVSRPEAPSSTRSPLAGTMPRRAPAPSLGSSRAR